MNLRSLQTSARLPSFQAEAEVDSVFGCGLNPGEGSAWCDERDIRLARLDGDLSEACGCLEESVKDRAELGSVGILSIDQVVGRGEHKVRVAKSLHHQKGLCIAGYSLFGQPGSETLFVYEMLFRYAPVPRGDVFPGALHEEPRGQFIHAAPISYFGHYEFLSDLVRPRACVMPL